jgi:hypothetical protein
LDALESELTEQEEVPSYLQDSTEATPALPAAPQYVDESAGMSQGVAVDEFGLPIAETPHKLAA